MPTIVTTTDSSSVTTHLISLKGVAGYIFYCLIAATLFAIVAFTTEGWAQVRTDKGGVKIGLWITCLCQPNLVNFTIESWFRSTQAMVTIGLVCIGGATITVMIYMFVHKFNKNRVLKMVLLLSCLGVTFTTIGLVVFGIFTMRYEAMQGFSYVFGVISGLLCGTACVLSCIQMAKSRTCNCCSCCKCNGDDSG